MKKVNIYVEKFKIIILTLRDMISNTLFDTLPYAIKNERSSQKIIESQKLTSHHPGRQKKISMKIENRAHLLPSRIEKKVPFINKVQRFDIDIKFL